MHNLKEGDTTIFDNWMDKSDMVELADFNNIPLSNSVSEYDWLIIDFKEYPALTFTGGKLTSHTGTCGHIISNEEFKTRILTK